MHCLRTRLGSIIGEDEIMKYSWATSALLAIVLGGFAAGVLDILYAFVMANLRGNSGARVLQAIASGLLGKDAYQGGAAIHVLGFALHFAILQIAAAIYLVAACNLQLLQQRYVVSGLLFGILVYLTMNFVVLPLSAVPFTIRYTPQVLLQGFVSHALLVGLPISACLHYFMARSAADQG
jgi:hypothetical protein